MTVLGIGPVILQVDPWRIPQWKERLACLGFRRAGESHTPDWDGHVMRHGRIQITLAGVRRGTAAAEQVAAHGDAVTDVTLLVDDVRAAYSTAIAGGAADITPPQDVYKPSLTMAAAGGAGQIRHTLSRVWPGAPRSNGPGPLGIACLALSAADAAAVEEAAVFYAQAYGFTRAAEVTRPGTVAPTFITGRYALLRSDAAALAIAPDPYGRLGVPAVVYLALAAPGSPRHVDLLTRPGPAVSPEADRA